MADITSETDNEQYDWRQMYSTLRHEYAEKCIELDRLLFDNRALTWMERVACGLVGVFLSLVIVSIPIYRSCAPRETQAEKDLIHALEAYRKATCAENVRHWFKTTIEH